jgi:very-short-patch-repair endonuclease
LSRWTAPITPVAGALMRAATLERAGYRVVRVEALLVVSDIERALELIRMALR